LVYPCRGWTHSFLTGLPMRKHDYISRINLVIDHVHENIDRRLTVAQLARVACLSPYHFHRVFSATLGETVGAFVRRARLERATQLLRASPRRRLGSVAMEVGFSSFSDFTRSFRRHYGIPPSRWDRRSRLEVGLHGHCPPHGTGANVLHNWIVSDDGPEPIAEVVRMAPLTLAYIRVADPTAGGALERGYDRLLSWLRSRNLAPPGVSSRRAPGSSDAVLLGMSWGDDELTPPHLLRYDFACSVPAGTLGSDGITVRTLPPLDIVRARASGSIGRVARVWNYIYGEWLPRSRWEPYHAPAFERYRSPPGGSGWSEWDVDCCVPIAR
jgi:AraC family transcriptional regulator